MSERTDQAQWERVSRLFEQALAMPAGERAAFLDAACGSDAELRREVSTLLEAEADADAFFDGLASDVGGPSVAALAEGAERDLEAGSVVGRYEVQGVIGRGGMGVVYEARDTRLGRTVALKLLPYRQAADPGARRRFVREAQAASTLDHPNVCTVHSIEETEAGQPFIVMARYHGRTLQALVEQGPLPVDDALDIAAQMAAGLAAAHARRIVHRDLKPANVMVLGEAGARTVKLLDFGIARRPDAWTHTSAGWGTVAYMAPEQARGEPVDARADLWSLGIILYEMIAGARPFEAETSAALLYAVLEQEPPALQARVPSVSEGVASIAARLLQRDLKARYASAAAVRRDLEAVQLGQPGPRLQRQRPRHRRAWVWGLAALLATVGVAGAWYLAPSASPGPTAALHPTPAATVAVLPFTVRGPAEMDYLQEGLADLLNTTLGSVPTLQTVDPNVLISHVKVLDEPPTSPAAASAVADRFNASHFVLGRATMVDRGYALHASLYTRSGEPSATAAVTVDDPEQLLEGVDRLAQLLVAGQLDAPDEQLAGLAALTTSSFPALVAYLDGERLLRENRFAEAAHALRRAVAVDSTFTLAWYRLARAAGWTGDRELNLRATDRAQRHAADLPERARLMIEGYHAFRRGDPRVAERSYRALLTRHPTDAETWHLLGETLFHNNPIFGRSTNEAYEPLRQALRLNPQNRELLLHLMELDARAGRPDALDSLSSVYLRPADDGAAVHMGPAYGLLRAHALMSESVPVAIDDVAAAGPDVLQFALTHIAPMTQDLGLAEALAARLAGAAYDDDARASGLVHQALFAAARGRPQAAEGGLAEAARLEPDDALVHRAFIASLPFLPFGDADVVAVQEAVAAWDPPTALFGGQPLGDPEALRSYLLALLSLRLGDPIAARDYARGLRRRSGLATSLAADVEAWLAWHGGDALQALALLDEAAANPMPFYVRELSPLYSRPLGRYLRAEALFSLGRYEEALDWYAALHDGYYHWTAPLLGPALDRCAQALEALGEPERAAYFYRRLAELWADAAPPLRARAAVAGRRADRLQPQPVTGPS